MFKPNEKGMCLFDQLIQIEKSAGRWPEEYAILEPPAEGEFVWDVFWEMRNCQASGMSGPERINFREIHAWQEVREYRLDNVVVDMILKMDAAYVAGWHSTDKKKEKQRTNGKKRK